MINVIGVGLPVGLYLALMAAFVIFLAKVLMAEDRTVREAQRDPAVSGGGRQTPHTESAQRAA